MGNVGHGTWDTGANRTGKNSRENRLVFDVGVSSRRFRLLFVLRWAAGSRIQACLIFSRDVFVCLCVCVFSTKTGSCSLLRISGDRR